MSNSNSGNKLSEDARVVTPSMSLGTAFLREPTYIKGRRDWFNYRDLGIQAASKGAIRANHIIAVGRPDMTTGWHYHTCDWQWVYILKGSATLEFEDGTVAICRAGDSIFIPGGYKHNEIQLSDDNEHLELSVPGEIGTITCERPAGLPAQLREMAK